MSHRTNKATNATEDAPMSGNDFVSEQNIKDRMDEIARRYGKTEFDDPERDRLLSEIKILVRRLKEMEDLP